VLFLKPTLTSDMYGESFLTSGSLNLQGGAPADVYVAYLSLINYIFRWSLRKNSEKETPNITIN